MQGEARGCGVRVGLWHKVYVFNVRDVLLLSHVQSNCPGSGLTIPAIAFAAFNFGLGVLAPVCRQRAANLVLGFGEFSALPADVALVSFVGLYQAARHCNLLLLPSKSFGACSPFPVGTVTSRSCLPRMVKRVRPKSRRQYVTARAFAMTFRIADCVICLSN